MYSVFLKINLYKSVIRTLKIDCMSPICLLIFLNNTVEGKISPLSLANRPLASSK